MLRRFPVPLGGRVGLSGCPVREESSELLRGHRGVIAHP
ncbi:hypothetical protein trd_A0240 (plasmid) [Thermomicrobium roseum DSM 5159]|uniref:Uncharacterized protein n=1 Tax=Thermomicrobium roseum (strain ATCC 27502 / DSM 5159 / P-2) TaxID=309801 RepID=B9L376_THERP|nr:hypothetical protein trd_A0240 [Thermomicrobium roseum DSM 5159]